MTIRMVRDGVEGDVFGRWEGGGIVVLGKEYVVELMDIELLFIV